MMTDLDIIKECRQTGRTRTTTKNLLEKAYYKQMTKEIDISRVLIEGDTATIMGVKYKRIEEPKPETLFDVIQNLGYSVDMCYEIVDAVEKFQKPKEYQPKKEKEQQIKELVRECVKWCEEHPEESVEDYLKPQTPEQTEQGLKEAFREAVKQGVVSSVDKPKDDFMDKMVAELKGQNLTDLIYDWWEDVFTTNSNDDMENCIGRLVYWIEEWLPKEQSAAGSQNAYVECSVEGFNDAIKKIKRKLR